MVSAKSGTVDDATVRARPPRWPRRSRTTRPSTRPSPTGRPARRACAPTTASTALIAIKLVRRRPGRDRGVRRPVRRRVLRRLRPHVRRAEDDVDVDSAHAGRQGPGAGREHRRADHPDPAGVRVRQPGRRQPAAAHRRGHRVRHLRRAVRDRVGHRRVDLLDQPDHRAEPRPRRRLRAADGEPVPRGAGRRARRRGRGGAHRADRRPHDRVQRRDRGGRAGRADGVPAVLPALVRLRRHRASCSSRWSPRSSCCPPC